MVMEPKIYFAEMFGHPTPQSFDNMTRHLGTWQVQFHFNIDSAWKIMKHFSSDVYIIAIVDALKTQNLQWSTSLTSICFPTSHGAVASKGPEPQGSKGWPPITVFYLRFDSTSRIGKKRQTKTLPFGTNALDIYIYILSVYYIINI